MCMHREIVFHPLPETPTYFDEDKFKANDETQIKIYKDHKTPNQKKKLTYEQISAKKYNYARQVPMNGCFIDYDTQEEFETMKRIIVRARLKCLILRTQRGGQFLFRLPTFYKKELTGATNWFGYKFDAKASWVNKKGEEVHAVQNMRVCGMERIEVASWDLGTPIPPDTINIEELDVLPYWLWGKGKDEKLFKDGKMGKIKAPDTGEELPAHNYKIDDSPFTELMKMTEGGRHDYIFKYCRTFALYNGFLLDDFKAIIHAIHDEFLVKLGVPMSDSDLLGDIDKGWETYITELISDYHGSFDAIKRIWTFAKTTSSSKLDERRATEYLYEQYDFYVRCPKANGIYNELIYREKDGDYEYKTDLPPIRQTLKEYSNQNFKMPFFEEVEKQLMQMCAENKKSLKRSEQYVLSKNKVLSCIEPVVFDFSWLGTRPPTDVVFRWTWQSEEWVDEHKEDLGGLITKFIKDLSRNAKGIPQLAVEQWLYIIAGACMIPQNDLKQIVILKGGGGSGKSVYTSLIKFCLGEDMFNLSKIFDSSPQDSFWGAELDKGICCIVDDLPPHYNKDAFSYLKGAVTGTDTVEINEKFKPKRRLPVLPQIIACTNFEFKLNDKSNGMKRRVLILPTEFEIPKKERDKNLEHKLVLNTTDLVKIKEYKMADNFETANRGEKGMYMYTKEKGVLDSLNGGSLCWFANYSRYMYFKWLAGEVEPEDTIEMEKSHSDTFKNEFEIHCEQFIKWYIEHKCGTAPDRNLSFANCFFEELYSQYERYCEVMSIDKIKLGQFNIFCNKAIINLGYTIGNKKNKGKGYACRYVFFAEE